MKDLTISFFGLVASVIVVAILVFMELKWEFAFYSLMLFFIVPIGAIASGVGAAGGYYLGALLLNARPTPIILFNMVAISIGSYFTLNYVTYLLLEIDGEPVSSLVDFSGYMDVILTNMSMTIGRGNAETGELGNFGYVVALLQIVGFAVGGFVTYLFLKSKAFCSLCDKYYKRVWQDTRYSGEKNNEELVEGIKNIAVAFDDADIDAARARHNQVGVEKHSKQTHLRTQLTLQKCPECERKLLSFETSKQKGDGWEVIDDFSFSNIYTGTKDTATA